MTSLSLTPRERFYPSTEVTIDVDLLEVRAGELVLPCEMRAGARDSLLNGSWDPLDELLSANSEVDQVAQQLAYV